MQRTALVFGLAASTLIGAYLLVPRTDVPVPVPPPPPVSNAGPVTELLMSDNVLSVTARLDRGHLLASGTEPVWIDIGVKATGVQTRAPLSAVLVIDRSGSMAGDKIDAARTSAERFVRGLKDGDAVAVVSFGTDVTVDFPMQVVTDASRAAAIGVVARLEEGGGTNIDGGLAMAQRELERFSDASARVRRVVLISDGRPTEGDRRESTLVGYTESLRGRGVVTSTLGVGLDYNEDLMEHLASAGGGRYHYLKDGTQLARILQDELTQASNVVATNVSVYLPRIAGMFEVQAAPGYTLSAGDSRTGLLIGDLAAGEERHVLVKVAVAPSNDVVTFAGPEVAYAKAGQTAQVLLAQRADPFRMLRTADVAMLEGGRRDDVRVRVLQVEASVALTESMQAYASGDAAAAKAKLVERRAVLQAAAARTQNAALAEEAAHFDRAIGSVSAAPASSAAAQDMIKAEKARAFELRR